VYAERPNPFIEVVTPLRFDFRTVNVRFENRSTPEEAAVPETHPRIAPLEPPYAEATGEMLRRWMPPGADREPLELFRTLAVHDELFSRMRPLGAGILGRGRVAPLLREIVIHRTSALTGAEYEWGVHAVSFGTPLGLTDAQLVSTVHGGADDGNWSPTEAAVFRLADELHTTSRLSRELFDELSRHFADDQILELAITAGWYHTIAYVIGTAGVRPEPWAATFPPAPAPAPISAPVSAEAER
jgi:alkylhydroperoxidase family enzyme